MSWGIGLALDDKGKTSRQWNRWRDRRDGQKHVSRGLTGAALEQAVMGIAMFDPSLVKVVSSVP